MTIDCPARFDIPGLSTGQKSKLESAFDWLFGPNVSDDVIEAFHDGYRDVMRAIPKPVAPEQETEQ
jgi:hypothetical protein